jgi:hypothetical protein
MVKASAFAWLLAALLASACASKVPPAKEGSMLAALRGMVYDFDGRPVSEAEISVDGREALRSDINGRFLFGDLGYGRHEVQIKREGYESDSIAFDFDDERQIVYAKLYSAKQLLSLSEREAEARDWAEALGFLDRVEAVIERDGSASDPAARYLRAVVLFRRGEAAAARSILETLLAEGYDDAYIHLFLADLLQYKLGDAKGAEEQLSAFLLSRYESEVEARLRNLRETGE